MAKEPEHASATHDAACAFARDLGATEQRIRERISLIGFGRASILREAGLLAKDD